MTFFGSEQDEHLILCIVAQASGELDEVFNTPTPGRVPGPDKKPDQRFAVVDSVLSQELTGMGQAFDRQINRNGPPGVLDAERLEHRKVSVGVMSCLHFSRRLGSEIRQKID